MFCRPAHVDPVRTKMWVRPTALARATRAATFPPSACSGFQIHMPLPSGITGGGGRGGGGGWVVVVVVGIVVVDALTRAFCGAGAVGSVGVTTASGMGRGAATRSRGGGAGASCPGRGFELVEGLSVVFTAGDAEEALAQLATTPVDVAIVDFALPGGVDGGMLTARIKEQHPGVRVLIFTASLDPGQVRRAAGSAADGILLKSIPIDSLVAAIRDVAEGRRVVGRDLSGLLTADAGED